MDTSLDKGIKENFKINFIPNFFKRLSHNNSSLKGILSMYSNILLNGLLPLELKELIFLRIAKDAGCDYFLALHSYLKNIDKKKTIDITDKERKILQFSLKCVNSSKNVSEDDFILLEKEGFSKEEITEIIAISSLAINSINIAQALDLEIDNEVSDFLKKQNLDYKEVYELF